MKSYFTLLMLLVLTFGIKVTQAQRPEWKDKNSLPIWMTPEEETRKHEIGKNFLKSAAVAGPARNISEFERMEGVLVRYPLGLPTSVIASFSQQTIVYTLVSSTANETSCRTAYTNAGVNMTNCRFIRAATDSYWTRDYGPWFIVDQNDKVSIVDFPYDRPRPNDDAVNGVLATYFSQPIYSMPVITTGGNYMTDGWGISASTDLVVSENSQGEAWVKTQTLNYLGVSTYHITIDPLGDYIKHIDCWGKFLDVDKVLVASVPTSNANYSKYEQVATYFANQTSAYGTPYQVFRVYEPNGEPYTNSLILNNTVYVPIKNTSPNTNDNNALNVYRAAMPGYTVNWVYYTSWVSTDALHCRAMGLADRGMLYIKHMPLTGTKPYQSTFDITADITAYSNQSLVTDSLLVFYKTNVRTSFMPVTMTVVSGKTYKASIPVNANETSVSYYIFAKDNSGRREKHPLIGSPDPHTFTVAAPTITADFTASPTTATTGQTVTFTDASTGGTITSWLWNFGDGASPATSTLQGPVNVQYSTNGTKTVSLTVNGSITKTKTNYIYIGVPVTGVTVNPTVGTVYYGETPLQLTASVQPSNATNQNVTWSSSNTSVATVSTTGLVTSVGSGTAVITVTTAEGGKTATCNITSIVSVTGVTVSPTTVSLSAGLTQQLTATVSPSNATDKSVSWSSSNETVATVSTTGLVTAVSPGTADITVLTMDGRETATCAVTVGTCTYQTINSEGFASGWGIWVDGGTYCARTSSYPNTDPYSISLRYNSTSSLMTTSNLNLTSYSEITIDFSCYPSGSFTSSEGLQVQISTNGGSSYTTLKDFLYTASFQNNTRFAGTVVYKSLFTTNTRLRFRSHASTNDYFYIDNVVISGCNNQAAAPSQGAVKVAVVNPNSRIDTDLNHAISVYPNPSAGKVTISSSVSIDEPVKISVISMTGQVMMQKVAPIANSQTIDLENLVTGYCMIRIETRNEIVFRKILIMK